MRLLKSFMILITLFYITLKIINLPFAEKYTSEVYSLIPEPLQKPSSYHNNYTYYIPDTLTYSLAWFIFLEIFLWILCKLFNNLNQYFNAIYTLVFCLLSLNACTYILTDLFEKYTRVGGITTYEYEQFMIYKVNLSYFAIAYFIVDLICNVRDIEFLLHHIATIGCLVFHNQLNDVVMVLGLLFGEITNPILLIWRASKKDHPHINYYLTPINVVGFILVRVFILIGIVLQSTLKYHNQCNSTSLQYLNWIIFIGFNIGNFYWSYKIIRNFNYITKEKINTVKINSVKYNGGCTQV
jgi:hypothetical protein